MPKSSDVNAMFARVAPRYDLANKVLSLGIDASWRRKLVDSVARREPREILDLATGSGDVAFALCHGLPAGVSITGMDFCVPMLECAERRKVASADARIRAINFHAGDVLALPLPPESVDAVTISFGLRNMEDRSKALAEMRRVLRPGGWLHILEFSQPATPFRPFYYFYLKRVAPLLAGLVTGESAAYRYLADSISAFPDREGLSRELEAAGFSEVNASGLTMGIVALHSGRKGKLGNEKLGK